MGTIKRPLTLCADNSKMWLVKTIRSHFLIVQGTSLTISNQQYLYAIDKEAVDRVKECLDYLTKDGF